MITFATARGLVHMMTWLPSSWVRWAFIAFAIALSTAGWIALSEFGEMYQLGLVS
jgi:hypothetical protein